MNYIKKVAIVGSSIFGYVLFSVCAAANPHGAENFGKTHFIAGFEHARINRVLSPALRQPKPAVEGHQPFLINADGGVKTILFSPDDRVRETLLYLINNEKQYIHIAIFMFTDKEIANALLNAYRRGVGVMIITDPTNLKDRSNKIGLLVDQGVPVLVYNAHHSKVMNTSIMHHKFALFGKNIVDKRIIWTGSLNFTRSACECNQENILIMDDELVVNRFLHQFELLKERSYFYRSTRSLSGKKSR